MVEIETQKPWWRDLTRYQWVVLAVACMGWMFDTMDQRLFVLARTRAMPELVKPQADQAEGEARAKAVQEAKVKGADDKAVREASDQAAANARKAVETHYGGIATSVLLIGWATGGIFFGILADRWGRAKTMLLTIGIYSAFTGLSALSMRWWDFSLYRFLTGMGVGGEFAAGASLVAEVMPARSRPHALGVVQAMASVGNIIGSLIGLLLLNQVVLLAAIALPGWRLMFLVGILPALLVVFALRRIKEPESWAAAKAAAKDGGALTRQLGSWKELLGDKRWRYHTLIGVLLALAGVIGLWGVGFWTPELIKNNVLANEDAATQNRMMSIAMALNDFGAIFGILAFSWIAIRIGRRIAFALAFSAALAATIMVFGFMSAKSQIYWMVPIMGFANLALFGGYAIYFPELFPTRLRGTGTGFCYNVARYLAALGPFTLGGLTVLFNRAGFGVAAFRWAAISVACIYLVGLATLPFAPETKGKPLPE